MPTQAERIEALEAALQNLAETNNILQNSLHDANDRLDTLQATQREPTEVDDIPRGTRTAEPKVASPEFFYGQRNKVNQFITQLKMVITLQPSRFPDEQKKVGYAATFLRDEALLWIQPFLDKPEFEQPAWLHSFASFTKELKRIFGDPDEVATAERMLFQCRQRGSASRYITEFRRHAALLDWDSHALAAQFYRGLRDNIKDELARVGRPDDLEELINTTIRIDNRIFERQVERGDSRIFERHVERYTPPLYSRRPFDMTRGGLVKVSPSPRQSVTPAPMQHQTYITPDQRYSGPANPPKNFTPAGRLMPDEYKRRVAMGACVYCGDMGHVRKDCEKAKKLAPSTRTQNAQFRGIATSKQGKE